MSLKHALLGFLSYRPMTGYDLKQHFDRSIYYFWNANLSQIYPTLSKMRGKGWLTMEMELQEDRPNRKVYHITTSGREELQRWLQAPADVVPVRDVFLIKIFFGGQLDKEESLSQLRQHLALHQEQLADYQETVRGRIQNDIEGTGMEQEAFFWNLTLDRGIKYEQGWVEWCQETITKIKALTG